MTIDKSFKAATAKLSRRAPYSHIILRHSRFVPFSNITHLRNDEYSLTMYLYAGNNTVPNVWSTTFHNLRVSRYWYTHSLKRLPK